MWIAILVAQSGPPQFISLRKRRAPFCRQVRCSRPALVIERLSCDKRSESPTLFGTSTRNLGAPQPRAGWLAAVLSMYPRAPRISLIATGLDMPAVDHLSNNGALNVLLDRAIPGFPSGLPPDRTIVALFMNFARLTDKLAANATLLGQSCCATSSPTMVCERVVTFVLSTTWRMCQRHAPSGPERTSTAGERDLPSRATADSAAGATMSSHAQCC